MGATRTRPGFDAQIGGSTAPSFDDGTIAPLRDDTSRAPALTHLTGGAAFVVDRDLRYLVADGEALRVAGLSPQDVVGRNLSDVLDPMLSARIEAHCLLALEGEPCAYEHEAHGHTYLSRAMPLRDAGGGIYAALVVSFDITERRQAEALQRRSEETFSSLIECAPFGVFVVDASFRLRAVNRGADAVFREVEPLLGRDFAEILRAIWPEPFASDAIARFRHTLATGEPYAAARLSGARQRDPRVETYDWQIQRLTLPDGSFGVVCYFYDLTAIREAETVVAAAAARDAFLVAFADAVRSLISPGEIVRNAAALLGHHLGAGQAAYTEVDDAGEVGIVEHVWNDGTTPSLAGRHRLAAFGPIVDELKRGQTIVLPDVRRDARTSRPDVLATFGALSIGAMVAVPLVKASRLVAVLAIQQRSPREWRPAEVALAEEVAQRTWTALEHARAESALRDSESRLQLALEAAGMGTFVWHVDEGREDVDDRMLALWGLAPGQPLTLATAFDGLVHPDDRARYAAAIQRSLDPAGEGLLLEDVRVAWPDGGIHWLAIHGRTVFGGDPRRALRMAGTASDISDRKRTEAALREREERLKDADRRKDEFLAVLAHELRNPLAPIRAALELIRLGGDSPAVVERTRAMMERQVGHMVRLIDDLLEVSRITSGKISLQRWPSPLAALVSTAVEANRAQIDRAGIALHLDLPETPVLLDVDATRCVQVISNVLHNAVKFTDAPGHIRIAAQVEPAGAAGGDMLRLTVADSGVGISHEMLPRVFDLFTQDRADTVRSHSGLGIGLALARRLIELHGGAIEARSDGPGHGSTFTIRLPIAAGAEREVSAPAAAPLIRNRVVVIDDHADAANATAMLIAALGGEAHVACDGERGLAEVLAVRPDLVLLDIGMPGLDGYETCRRIRRTLGSSVVIVALTGWGQEQDKQAAVLAGFDAHLTKPADPAALARLLASTSPAAHG
jgi:PAS domain S-box-containing protein